MNLEPALPYERWIEDAMRTVVRQCLREVAANGLPGAHHFYISFATSRPGVILADELRARYPDEMTVVLQHQFWDLVVGEEAFEVTLKFRGRLQRLTVPFAAVTGFIDPSVNFALHFRSPTPAALPRGEGGEGAASAPTTGPHAPAASAEAGGSEAAGEVITLDRFRKK